jgi:hypothetical protein
LPVRRRVWGVPSRAAPGLVKSFAEALGPSMRTVRLGAKMDHVERAWLPSWPRLHGVWCELSCIRLRGVSLPAALRRFKDSLCSPVWTGLLQGYLYRSWTRWSARGWAQRGGAWGLVERPVTTAAGDGAGLGKAKAPSRGKVGSGVPTQRLSHRPACTLLHSTSLFCSRCLLACQGNALAGLTAGSRLGAGTGTSRWRSRKWAASVRRQAPDAPRGYPAAYQKVRE